MSEVTLHKGTTKLTESINIQKKRVILTASEIYVSSIRTLPWLLLSLKEVVRYEMLTKT